MVPNNSSLIFHNSSFFSQRHPAVDREHLAGDVGAGYLRRWQVTQEKLLGMHISRTQGNEAKGTKPEHNRAA